MIENGMKNRKGDIDISLITIYKDSIKLDIAKSNMRERYKD